MKKEGLSPIEVSNRYFKTFIDDMEDIIAVSVGGSVARGQHILGSDIDLLYFEKNGKTYRKKYQYRDGWPIEIHRIPINFPYLLASQLSPLFDLPLCLMRYSLEYDTELIGEKQCPFDNDSRSVLRASFSASRELDKILDSVVLWQRNRWLDQLKQDFSQIRPNHKKIRSVLLSFEELTNIWVAAFSALRIDAILFQRTLSKVMWIDHYLCNHDNNRLYNIFLDLFSLPHFLLKENFEDTSNLVAQMRFLGDRDIPSCSICRGVIKKCHVGRCAIDYLNDAERALKKGWIIGALFSLKKANENALFRMKLGGLFPPQYHRDWLNTMDKEVKRNNYLIKKIIKEIMEYHKLDYS